ncbi:MAG: urease accessory protein UreD [Cellvibrionaceae bacterium]
MTSQSLSLNAADNFTKNTGVDNASHDEAAKRKNEKIEHREWLATIELAFLGKTLSITDAAAKTKLIRAKHLGPLRIQRPFYPEGDCCHCYLLHPPGGIAAGDDLTISAELVEKSHVLLTTPSAGKVYTSDSHGHPQRQGIHAKISADSCLEWLPQETIIFSGAQVKLTNRFNLEGNGHLIGWDMVCLGRRASGEQFLEGDCVQSIEIYRDDILLMRERTHWQGNSSALTSTWGMAGHVVSGTLFATLETSRQQMDDWREGLAELALTGEWGLSQKPGVFTARFLGRSAEQGRKGFEYLWSQLRPLINGRDACRPRIWNT